MKEKQNQRPAQDNSGELKSVAPPPFQLMAEGNDNPKEEEDSSMAPPPFQLKAKDGENEGDQPE